MAFFVETEIAILDLLIDAVLVCASVCMLAKLARGVARCIGDGQHVSKVQSLETGESWPEFL